MEFSQYLLLFNVKKLIIHFGYRKTATTTLQMNLFNKLHQKGYMEYLNHTNLINNNIKQFNIKNVIDFILGTNYKDNKIESEFNNLKLIKNKISLISNENISLFHDDFSYLKLDDFEINNTLKIKNLFDKYFDSMEILIVIRAQKSIIPFFYAETYGQLIAARNKFKNIEF